MNEWINEWVNEWINEWMNECEVMNWWVYQKINFIANKIICCDSNSNKITYVSHFLFNIFSDWFVWAYSTFYVKSLRGKFKINHIKSCYLSWFMIYEPTIYEPFIIAKLWRK